MAQITRVRRIANPHGGPQRRAALRKRKLRKNPKRRKMTAKQIRHFGTRRQKAALAASTRRKRTTKRKAVAVKANPTHRRRRVARRNPALVVTLGALNPRPRRKVTTVPKTRKRRRANPKARVHRRRRTAVAAPRHHRRRRIAVKANPVHRRRRYAKRNPARRVARRRRSNPFGSKTFSVGTVKMVGGGLLGILATKWVSSIVGKYMPSVGTFGGVLTNAVSAVAIGMLANKFIPGPAADGIAFGALMQTGSVLINTVAPGLKLGDYPVALSGFGDLVPGSFPVPQNPLRQLAAPAPAGARVQMSGLSRAFGTAF